MKKEHKINRKIKISNEDVKLLNSKIGLNNLFENPEIDLTEVLAKTKGELVLQKLAVEMVKLQSYVIKKKKKVVIIFEGRDAAGKGGTIRQLTKSINPRHFKTVALNKPSKKEKGEWYFKRYVKHLPREGEIVFFDRSWYNRAIVEPVNGFCTKKEYANFMKHVNAFEEMLVMSEIQIIKIYLSITKKEQEKRFEYIKSQDITRWKISDVDKNAQKLWSLYTKYKNLMFKKSNTKYAPWHVIDANNGIKAKIESIKYILKRIPYN